MVAENKIADEKPPRIRSADFASLLLVCALRVAPLPVNGKVVGFDFICPFLNLTHLPCPFCGLTRATIYSAHFQFDQAFQYHVLGPLLLAALLASSTRLLVLVTCRAFPKFKLFCSALVGHIARPKLPARFVLLWLTAFTALLWIARLAGFLPLPHSVF